MKKINKPISFVLALMMCLCLAGCGDETENSTPTGNNSSTNNSVSAPENSNESSNSETSNTPGAEITFEPINVSVTEITIDPTAGYGFHRSTTYGNAFSLICSYGSDRGRSITNATITIVPIEMKNLDDILATEWCKDIKKEELAEADLGGVMGWTSTEEAAGALTESYAERTYDGLYVEMKIDELTAAGISTNDAIAQAMNNLADVGLGDVG